VLKREHSTCVYTQRQGQRETGERERARAREREREKERERDFPCKSAFLRVRTCGDTMHVHRGGQDTIHVQGGGGRHTRHIRQNNVRCADNTFANLTITKLKYPTTFVISLSMEPFIYPPIYLIHTYIDSPIHLFTHLPNTYTHRSIEYRAYSRFDAQNVSKMHVRQRMCVCLCVCTIHHLISIECVLYRMCSL
jgi:hypothetical protein